jgi:uncharacterized membrane protein
VTYSKTADAEAAIPGHATESRWPASLALISALVLYVTLPEHLTLGPPWILALVELALIIPVALVFPRRTHHDPHWLRTMAIVLIATINAANVASLIFLVRFLLTAGQKATGIELLVSSLEVWLTNIIVFALWYWELDRGGPNARLAPTQRPPDFLFPQTLTPSTAPPGWRPQFFDYFYVAFTNATAFSPTDTMPLTQTAKMLMAVQSMTSLLTVALVAARAVNILS